MSNIDEFEGTRRKTSSRGRGDLVRPKTSSDRGRGGISSRGRGDLVRPKTSSDRGRGGISSRGRGDLVRPKTSSDRGRGRGDLVRPKTSSERGGISSRGGGDLVRPKTSSDRGRGRGDLVRPKTSSDRGGISSRGRGDLVRPKTSSDRGGISSRGRGDLVRPKTSSKDRNEPKSKTSSKYKPNPKPVSRELTSQVRSALKLDVSKIPNLRQKQIPKFLSMSDLISPNTLPRTTGMNVDEHDRSTVINYISLHLQNTNIRNVLYVNIYSLDSIASIRSLVKSFGADVSLTFLSTDPIRFEVNDGEKFVNFYDMDNMDFGYDLIILFDVITHVENYGNFIDSIRRLLNQDGHILVSDKDVSSYQIQVCEDFYHMLKYHIIYPDSTYEHYSGYYSNYCSQDDIDFFLKIAGFEEQDTAYRPNNRGIFYSIYRLKLEDQVYTVPLIGVNTRYNVRNSDLDLSLNRGLNLIYERSLNNPKVDINRTISKYMDLLTHTLKDNESRTLFISNETKSNIDFYDVTLNNILKRIFNTSSRYKR